MPAYPLRHLIELIPQPARDANKYSRGKAIVVGGSSAYPGAACLCAHATQVSGAGYTEVFTEKSARAIVQSYRPSLVVRTRADFELDPEALAVHGHPCAYVVGSGFDSHDDTERLLLRTILDEAACPVLVDGGALTYLSRHKLRTLCAARGEQGRATVLTPHVGEARRLLRHADIAPNDLRGMALEIAREYDAIVVLKSSDTFVSNGEEAFVVEAGTPALAKAGTGDVLAGIIGGLLAQGLDALDACALGTLVHALAGQTASAELTDISTCAEDVVAAVPAVFSYLLSDNNHL